MPKVRNTGSLEIGNILVLDNTDHIVLLFLGCQKRKELDLQKDHFGDSALRNEVLLIEARCKTCKEY